MFTTNNAPQTFTRPKSTTETVDGSMKHVQSKQQRHKTTSLTSLWCLYPTPCSNAPIFDFEKAVVRWAIIISKENTPKAKSAELQ